MPTVCLKCRDVKDLVSAGCCEACLTPRQRYDAKRRDERAATQRTRRAAERRAKAITAHASICPCPTCTDFNAVLARTDAGQCLACGGVIERRSSCLVCPYCAHARANRASLITLELTPTQLEEIARTFAERDDFGDAAITAAARRALS